MSQLVYTLQANIYSLIILVTIFVSFRKRTDQKNTSNRIFLILLKVNMAILILDSINICLFGSPGKIVHFWLSLFMLLYYLLNPLPGLYWMAYTHNYLYQNKKRFNKIFLLALIPVIINGLLSIASIFNGCLFIISEDNLYQRGWMFFVLPILIYCYFFLSFVMIFLNRNRVSQRELLPLLFFALPPFLGGILQTVLYGVILVWPSVTLSLLIIYIFIQSRMMNTDHLTGLFNRREFDYYLEGWRNWHKKTKQLAGFMLDLDHFKTINDTYGHQKGDEALIDMGEILRKTFRCNDFIARIGGDEFAVVLEVADEIEIDRLITRLQDNIAFLNQQTKQPYQLSVSFGTGLFSPEEGQTLSGFVRELDRRMYAEKSQKKQGHEQIKPLKSIK